MPNRYLGDGVYAEYDGYHVILSVPAGSSISGLPQRIALDPDVLVRLSAFHVDAKREYRAEQDRLNEEAKEKS